MHGPRLVTCKPIVRRGWSVGRSTRLRYVLILIMYATAFLLITVDRPDCDAATLRYVIAMTSRYEIARRDLRTAPVINLFRPEIRAKVKSERRFRFQYMEDGLRWMFCFRDGQRTELEPKWTRERKESERNRKTLWCEFLSVRQIRRLAQHIYMYILSKWSAVH